MREKLDPIVLIDQQIENLMCRYMGTDMSGETYSKRLKRLVEKRDRIVEVYKRKVLDDEGN